MKFTKKIIFCLILSLIYSMFFAAVPVFAEKPDCRLKTSQGGGAIPDTFSVRDCLTTEGQEESKFVPKDSPPAAEGEEAPAADGQKQTVSSVLVEVIDLFVKVIASVALLVFILGALLTITAKGKEDRLEKGKTAMLYAIIGLVIALFSFVIVTFVQSILF